MKRLLFETTDQHGLRIALAEDHTLLALIADTGESERRVGNIYKGVVTQVEFRRAECLIDYGPEREGTLPFMAMAPDQVPRNPFDPVFHASPPAQAAASEPARPRGSIWTVIARKLFGAGTGSPSSENAAPAPRKQDQEVLVQIVADESAEQGATLTTDIRLTGRYLVLVPQPMPGTGPSHDPALHHLKQPPAMRVLAHPAAADRNNAELQWDLDYLLRLWEAIASAAASLKGANLIYLEASPVIRAIRDLYAADIAEILVDTEDIFEQVQTYLSLVLPEAGGRVKRYGDPQPLFSRFQLETQAPPSTGQKLPSPAAPAGAPGKVTTPNLGEDGIYPGYPVQ